MYVAGELSGERLQDSTGHTITDAVPPMTHPPDAVTRMWAAYVVTLACQQLRLSPPPPPPALITFAVPRRLCRRVRRYACTRNAYLELPAQRAALLCVTWVTQVVRAARVMSATLPPVTIGRVGMC